MTPKHLINPYNMALINPSITTTFSNFTSFSLFSYSHILHCWGFLKTFHITPKVVQMAPTKKQKTIERVRTSSQAPKRPTLASQICTNIRTRGNAHHHLNLTSSNHIARFNVLDSWKIIITRFYNEDLLIFRVWWMIFIGCFLGVVWLNLLLWEKFKL